MSKYDYLVVGAGLFGAVFAHEAALRGKHVKVIEKRNHIAGNIYTKEVDGIQVHKHFEFGKGDKGKTIITREYPANWNRGDEPYYPVNITRNNTLYKQYAELAKQEGNVIFGGRLGQYRYYDMHQVIHTALVTVNKISNL